MAALKEKTLPMTGGYTAIGKVSFGLGPVLKIQIRTMMIKSLADIKTELKFPKKTGEFKLNAIL